MLRKGKRRQRINLFDWASLNWNCWKIECFLGKDEQGDGTLIIEFVGRIGNRRNNGKLLILQIIQFSSSSPSISSTKNKKPKGEIKRAEEINNVNFHEFFLFLDLPISQKIARAGCSGVVVERRRWKPKWFNGLLCVKDERERETDRKKNRKRNKFISAKDKSLCHKFSGFPATSSLNRSWGTFLDDLTTLRVVC